MLRALTALLLFQLAGEILEALALAAEATFAARTLYSDLSHLGDTLEAARQLPATLGAVAPVVIQVAAAHSQVTLAGPYQDIAGSILDDHADHELLA